MKARVRFDPYYADTEISHRWKDWESFMDDLGPKPDRSYSLERIDNSLGYTQDNCKWGSRSEQRRNQRPREKDPKNGKFVKTKVPREKGYTNGEIHWCD